MAVVAEESWFTESLLRCVVQIWQLACHQWNDRVFVRLAVIEWVCCTDKWVALVIRILPTDRRGEKRRKKRKTRGHKRRGEGSIRNLSTFICSSCRHPFLLLSSFGSCFLSFHFILYSFCHLLCWSCLLIPFSHLLLLVCSLLLLLLFVCSNLLCPSLLFILIFFSLHCFRLPSLVLSFLNSLLPVLVFFPPLLHILFCPCFHFLFILFLWSYIFFSLFQSLFLSSSCLLVFFSSSLHSSIFFFFFLSPSGLIVIVLFSYLSSLSSLVFVLVFSSFGPDSSPLSPLGSSSLLVLIFFSSLLFVLFSFFFSLLLSPYLICPLFLFLLLLFPLFFSSSSLIYLS